MSWLPSFSVEVTHSNSLRGVDQTPPAQTSQLDAMARQVSLSLFIYLLFLCTGLKLENKFYR